MRSLGRRETVEQALRIPLAPVSREDPGAVGDAFWASWPSQVANMARNRCLPTGCNGLTRSQLSPLRSSPPDEDWSRVMAIVCPDCLRAGWYGQAVQFACCGALWRRA
jgi:hypothetical protein